MRFPSFTHVMLLVTPLWVAACSSLSVEREIVVPPELAALHGRKAVFVADFEGARGMQARAAVLDALSRPSYHRIATRPQPGGIVIRGGVSEPRYGDQTRNMTIEECVARDKKNKCTRKEKKLLYTRAQECELSVRIEVVEPDTGRILYTTTAEGGESSNDSYKEGESRPPDLKESLCGEAVAGATADVVKKLRASMDEFDLDFEEVADPNGETKRAVQLVEGGDLEGAEQLLAELPASSSLTADDRGWARYNLALVHFAMERFGDCADDLDAISGGPAKNASRTRALRERCIRFR